MRTPSTDPLLARATQLLAAGRSAEAIGVLGEAARLQPSNPAIQHDLGLACLESGRVPDAIAAFDRAVAGNPRFAKAHMRLGIALERHGEPAAALAAYRRAAALLPSLSEAQFRGGDLLERLGHTTEAIAFFRRAAAGAKTGLGRIGAARALLLEHRDAEAARILRQTLALDPANAMALDLLGTVLADAGDFEAARDCYERAIALSPLLAGSYYELVRCRRVTPSDERLIAGMDRALSEPGLDGGQRLRVHLALGKAADDLGDHARAMRHFDAADAMRRAVVDFQPAAFDALASRLMAHCTPELMARAAELGCHDAAPVLILGMPRSGTTLVEQILSCHPDVSAGGELPFWIERGLRWGTSDPAAWAEAPFLAEAAEDYLRLLRGIAPLAGRVTDKMPLNFVWAGLIHLTFPRATILHCRRSPIDTALSIHQTYFNPRLPFPTGGPELVAYTRTYERLMEHWRRVLPPDRFLDVEYEALTAEPEPNIRRIVAGCGLSWDDACLHPERHARIIKTPSKWQARQPIYRTAVERWRRYEPWLGALGPLRPDGSPDDGPANYVEPRSAI